MGSGQQVLPMNQACALELRYTGLQFSQYDKKLFHLAVFPVLWKAFTFVQGRPTWPSGPLTDSKLPGEAETNMQKCMKLITAIVWFIITFFRS